MTYVSTCLADGAVGLWTLGDASVVDTATAIDETGIQNGVYANSGWTGGQTGIPGSVSVNAAKVTAGSSFITVADVAGNRTANTFTYELWIKMAALPGTTAGLMGTQGNKMLRLETDGTIRLTEQAVQDIVISSGSVAADNAWHYIVCTKSAGTPKLYIDSTDVTGTVNNDTFGTSAGYYLARNNADNAPAATFAMFAVYATALSSGTISNHWSLGSVALTTYTKSFSVRTG